MMPRFHRTVPIDDYVLDVLMRDIVGHDQQPAAFLVYLYLSGRAARQHWQPVKSSLRMLADETGLSKSAVQSAIVKLQYPAVGKNLARAPDRRAGTSRLTTLAIETGPQTFSEVIPIASSLFRLH